MTFITTCSQRTKFKTALFSGLFALLLLPLASCKEETSNVGLELQPGSEDIDVLKVDTFTLLTSTVGIDSIRTDELSQNILGSINDEIFGRSSADIITEFRLPENNLSFGATPELDSIVLTLRYYDKKMNYGNSSTPLKFRVSRLKQRIYTASTYNNKTSYSIDAADLSFSPGTPRYINQTDSVKVREGKSQVNKAPHLRIRLSDAFGNELLNAGSAVYANDENFLNFLNGLAVISENNSLAPGQGGIFGVNLSSAISGITIYYNDTLQKSLIVNTNCARIGRYTHPLKNAQMQAQIANPSGNYDTTFVQSLGVAKTRIQIPGLLNILQGKNTVLNYAELIVPVIPGSVGTSYAAPPRLDIFAIDSNGANQFVVDYFSGVYSGATFNAAKGEYRFYLTRHIQQILGAYKMQGRNLNRGFYLMIPTDFPVSASRLMLDTRKSPERKIRLNLIYSKLE